MPSFLAGSFAVAGLIAAAAPLVIHLLNRRRYRVVPWAAMELLREALVRNRKMLQLRDLLLLALRTLCILLFALALARPVFSPKSAAGDPDQPVHAVLLVDNSLSMGYERLGRTLLDDARLKLNEFLERLPLGSRISVLPLCGSSQPYAHDVYRTVSDAREALARIEVVDRAVSLPAALDLALEACAAAADMPAKRVVLVGDQQRRNWPQEGIDQLLVKVPDLQIVQISTEAAPANAWIADFRVPDDIADTESPTLFTATIHYEGSAPRENVEVALLVDGVRVAAEAIDLAPGQARQVRFLHQFEEPVEEGEIQFAVASLSLTADQLPLDDERFLAVPIVSSLPVLFIDQVGVAREEPQANRYGETFHLRRLLSPVSSRAAEARELIFVRHATPDEVEREHLEDCRLVVIAGVENPSRLVPLLRDYVEQGGQLLIAAGGGFDPQAWSSTAWLEGAGLLPLPLKREPIGQLPDEAATRLKPFFLSPESLIESEFQIAGASREELENLYRTPLFFKAIAVDQSDEVLAALREADIERAKVARQLKEERTRKEGQQKDDPREAGTRNGQSPDEAAQELTEREPGWLIWGNAAAQGADGLDDAPEKIADRQRPKILASFSNGAPFLVSRQVGRGQIVFASSGVMAGWNNLTRTNAVVLFDRLLRGMISHTLPRRNYGTEDRPVIPIVAAERRDTFSLERPGGARENLFVDAAGDDRFSVALTRLTQRGAYRVVAERPVVEPSASPGGAIRAAGRLTGPQVDRLWQVALAVNGPADESNLKPVTEDDLRDRFGNAAVRWVGPEEPIQLEGAKVRGQETWKWLMAAALGCLLAELGLLAVSHGAVKKVTGAPRSSAGLSADHVSTLLKAG